MKKSSVTVKFLLMLFLFICGCSKDKVVNSNPPPPPTNKTPTANGGPDHIFYVPRDTVSIDARQSFDGDGNIVLFSLTQISGPAPSTIENHPSLIGIYRVKKLIAGSYDFELMVTDNKGATATDNIRIDVIQGPPSGTEYVLDSLQWNYSWDDDAHILQTPFRSDIFPSSLGWYELLQFPADFYLRYDTATLWSKLPTPDTHQFTDGMLVYIYSQSAAVFDRSPRNLAGRKASLRIKFH